MTIDELLKNKKKCINYYSARSQRKIEYKLGIDISGTKGYEIRGCYSCNGLNKTCKAYRNYNNLIE
jgi:hypothetical protein